MSGNPDNRRRLAGLMEQRRVELGLTWKQAAEAGGISYEAIRAVRHDDSDIRGLTKHGIDVGLRWQPGSVQAILDGGEPSPVSPLAAVPPPAEDPVDAIDDLTDEEIERIGRFDELELMLWRARGFTRRQRLDQIENLRHERAKYGPSRTTDNTGSAGTALTLR